MPDTPDEREREIAELRARLAELETQAAAPPAIPVPMADFTAHEDELRDLSTVLMQEGSSYTLLMCFVIIYSTAIIQLSLRNCTMNWVYSRHSEGSVRMKDERSIHNLKSNLGLQGDFHGDVNLVVADFGAAIEFLRQLARQQDSDAVEKVVETLHLIVRYQKTVSELKSVHNALHDLVEIMSTQEHDCNSPELHGAGLVRRIQSTWRNGVRVRCERIEVLASRLRFAADPLVQNGDELTGPQWAIPLMIWRRDFELCLRELALEQMCDLWLDGLSKCRDSLYIVDGDLFDVATKLDFITDRLVHSLGSARV